MSDLSSYFHEKARAQIAAGRSKRAGLLATQSIRGGLNRRVLQRILTSGGIFFARSDEPWILSGANVHVSFVGQDDGTETNRELDGRPVRAINANLTSGVDVTRAKRLRENAGIAFIGDVKGGSFDIDEATAQGLMEVPNPDGRDNRAVLSRWVNGQDMTGRSRNMWIIDFGIGTPIEEAALYEAPFEYVRNKVKPEREAGLPTIDEWWLHERPGHSMRAALAHVGRQIATARVSKHRLFVWLPPDTIVDSAGVSIARDDDYTLGVLQSKVHELWTRATGTQLRESTSGSRYTPIATFETFPFPLPTTEQRERVGEAARRLVELRDGWLNPPDLDPADLERRTLTNLYNQRPTWLDHAHASLDDAIFAAYGWPPSLTDGEILSRLLALNLEHDSA